MIQGTIPLQLKVKQNEEKAFKELKTEFEINETLNFPMDAQFSIKERIDLRIYHSQKS